MIAADNGCVEGEQGYWELKADKSTGLHGVYPVFWWHYTNGIWSNISVRLNAANGLVVEFIYDEEYFDGEELRPRPAKKKKAGRIFVDRNQTLRLAEIQKKPVEMLPKHISDDFGGEGRIHSTPDPDYFFRQMQQWLSRLKIRYRVG